MPPSDGSHAPPPRYEDALHHALLRLPPFARELIAGGVAGGLAKSCVAPLERTKIIFQTRGTSDMTVKGVLGQIWRTEGVVGLFRGNTASVLRIVPYAALHFGSYEYIRRAVVQLAGAEVGHGPDAPSALPLYDLLAGSASGAVAVVATYPLDLVRTRLAWETEAASSGGGGGGSTARPPHQQQAALGTAPTAVAAPAGSSTAAAARQQAHPHPHHPSIMSIIRSTTAEEGVAGLYRGCWPTIIGILPYAGLKFYVYQQMKNTYRRWQQRLQARQRAAQQRHVLASVAAGSAAGSSSSSSSSSVHAAAGHHASSSSGSAGQQKLPVVATLLFGGAAGLVAQTVTYPLDVIRRQMQVSHLQLAAQQAPAGEQQQPLRPVRGARMQPAAAAAAADPGMLQVAQRVWRSGAMFRGLSLNYIKVVPSTAIGFTAYDAMKAHLGLSH